MTRLLHRYVLKHRQKTQDIPLGVFHTSTAVTRCECGWVWAR